MNNNRNKYKSSAQLKLCARKTLLGKLGPVVWANIMYTAVSYLLTYAVQKVIPDLGAAAIVLAVLLSYVASVLLGVVAFGLHSMYMDLAYEQPIVSGSLFRCFRENADKFICIQALLSAIATVCSAPALIYTFLSDMELPTLADMLGGTMDFGFVHIYAVYFALEAISYIVRTFLMLRFYICVYLLLDFPELSAKEAITTSWKKMSGSMGRAFYIELSFIPLYILGIISFGLANLWIMAYHYMTQAEFYKDLIIPDYKRS